MAISARSHVIMGAWLVLAVAYTLTTIKGVESKPIPAGRRVQPPPTRGGARRGLAGETVFDITKFEAVADGKTDNANGIIKAWRAACDATGPAKVVIPLGNFLAGEIVFVGPCAGGKPITVEVQGNLWAVEDPSAYSGKAWISFEKVNNVILNGGGTIDAKGASQWKYAHGDVPLAASLQFQTVGYGKIHDLKFVNSMGFHIRVTDSNNVAVWNLNISAPGDSPNTDGIHASSNVNLNITDSIIGTGDDCVSIGHGNNNVLVSGVTCGPGHGLSVGSLGKRPDETDLKGVIIRNCTLRGTTNGARIKSYHASPEMEASGIVFEDIIMEQVKNPIIIDQHYNSKKVPQQSKVKLSDIHFRNIRGTSISPVSIALNCSSIFPCEGVELSNIELEPFGTTRGPLQSVCSNAKTIIKDVLNLGDLATCI